MAVRVQVPPSAPNFEGAPVPGALFHLESERTARGTSPWIALGHPWPSGSANVVLASAPNFEGAPVSGAFFI